MYWGNEGETLTFQTFLSLIGKRMNEVVDNEELRVAFSVFDRDNQEPNLLN